MHKQTYPNLAAAIGAFVTGEMLACQADPTLMLTDNDAEGAPLAGAFDMHGFENHLVGIISDLAYLCLTSETRRIHELDPDRMTDEVTLVIATSNEVDTQQREWQWCAQGYACLEVA